MAVIYDPYSKVTVQEDSLPTPLSGKENGDYIVHRSNGKEEYVEFPSELATILTLPDEDGTYVLTCVVDDGEATLSWEAQE